MQLVCHDLKSCCHKAGRIVHGCVFDTMLADYLLDPGTSDHGVDAVFAKHPEKADCVLKYLEQLWKKQRTLLEENGALLHHTHSSKSTDVRTQSGFHPM